MPALPSTSGRWVSACVFAVLLSSHVFAADEADTGSHFDNIDIVDATLAGKVSVTRVGSEPSPNNLLSVFAGLKNKTSHRLDLEVETIYQDVSGNSLNAGSWIHLSLMPYEEKEYRSTSISEPFDPDAMTAHFLIRVRRASKTK